MPQSRHPSNSSAYDLLKIFEVQAIAHIDQCRAYIWTRLVFTVTGLAMDLKTRLTFLDRNLIVEIWSNGI